MLHSCLFVLTADVCAANDRSLHVRVRVQLVKVDNENEIDMLSIVMRINRCLKLFFRDTSIFELVLVFFGNG